MFLRSQIRKKDGKEHIYWSVVENKRLGDGRVLQRQVLYLGEVNDSQRAAWRKTLEAHTEGEAVPRQIALFPHDRPAPTDDERVVQIRLDRVRLRVVRRREGRYLLRSNLTGRAPAELWNFYMLLVQVEEAFKDLKGDLGVRPVFHQKMERIEAHIFVAFVAYALHVCLRQRLRAVAGGLTSRAVLEKFSAVQMVDVHLPTTDGRTVILSRHTQPEKDLQVLLAQLKLVLPAQPPPKITTAAAPL